MSLSFVCCVGEQGHGCSNDWVCPCCNASVLCAKSCAKGANLLSHFSSSSYQVITDSPLKYQHGAGTLVMVEKQHRSSCNYDSFLLPLLSLHNQLHRGCDSPFMLMLWIWSVDRQILSHVVFRAWHLKWNEESVRFQPDRGDGFALASMIALRRVARLHLY